MESFHISDLASEILLFIFLHLDLPQLVRSRQVNKQFQEAIDSNQLLWRIFEWIQQDQESFRPSLDMFDEKSQHSLEHVSIREKKSKEEDLLYLMQVLQRSRENLREVNIHVDGPREIESQIVEMMTAGSRLRRLVVWGWLGAEDDNFPLCRLLPSNSKVQEPSMSQLQLLWVYNGVEEVDSKHLKSLRSFAQIGVVDPGEFRKVICNFSNTIVHLSILLDYKTSRSPLPEPLSCPNLRCFEGYVLDGFSSFFDAPRLQTFILRNVGDGDFEGIPASVEEIWLYGIDDILQVEHWNLLFVRSCPKLKVLKVDKTSQHFTSLVEALEVKDQMAQDEKKTNGIKIVPLQTLVLETKLYSVTELARVAKVVGEVLDLKDYPKFVEIKY